jgi:hypothetical protein
MRHEVILDQAMIVFYEANMAAGFHTGTQTRLTLPAD